MATSLIKSNIDGKALVTDGEALAVQLSFDVDGGGAEGCLDGDCHTVKTSAVPRDRSIGDMVIVAELQCQLVNLANAVNRLDYETASTHASRVRTLMAGADEHVSRLPADVERAVMAARLSALTCAAERLLLAAPRTSSGSFDRTTTACHGKRRWIQERNSGGSVSLVYDRGTLICHTWHPHEDSELNKGRDDVETSLVASNGGGRDSDRPLAFTSARLQLRPAG